MSDLIGKKVVKSFPGMGDFRGEIVGVSEVDRALAEEHYPGQNVTHFFKVQYEDGDFEEYSEAEVRTYLCEETRRGSKRRVSDLPSSSSAKARRVKQEDEVLEEGVVQANVSDEEVLDDAPPPEDAGGRRKRVTATRQGTVFTAPATTSGTDNPGSILKIHLENANLDVSFGPNINFVVGENGSGKSAILTALSICFGTKARSTNRASTLKTLIKAGAYVALVAVTVNNKGGEGEAYKYEQYGERIIIERRIQQSGSTIVLKNQNGEKVSTGKAELDQLLDHFSIDVSNPCTIMTQDASRSFLHSGKDEDKYKFFMQGTLLQQTRDRLLEIDKHIVDWEEHVGKREEEIPQHEDKLKRLQDALQEAQAVEDLKVQEEHIQRKLIWVYVKAIKDDMDAIYGRIAEEDPPADAQGDILDHWGDGPKKLAKENERVEAMKHKLAEAEQKKLVLYDKCEQVSNELKRLIDGKQMVQREHSESRRLTMRTKSSLKQNENNLHSLQHRTQQIKESIEEIQRAQAAAAASQKENASKQDLMLTIARNRLQESKDAYEQAGQQLQACQMEEQQKQKAVDEIKREYDHFRHQIQQSEGILRQLNQSITSEISKFGGQQVHRLLDLIKKNGRRFNYLPVGPIGVHCKLQNPEWAQAVDVCIGGALNNFIVHNFKDREVFKELCRQLKLPDTAIVYPHDKARYRLSENDIPDPSRFQSVLSAVEISHDLVYNVLVDQTHLESVIILDRYDEGVQHIFNHRQRNVREAILKDGTKMEKRGDTEITQPFRSKRLPRLGVDHSQQVAQQEQQILHDQQSLREVQERARAVESELNIVRGHCREASELKRSTDRFVREARAQVEELESEARMGEDTNEVNVGDLEEELQTLDREAAVARDEIERGRVEVVEAETKEKDVEVRAKEHAGQCNAMQQQHELHEGTMLEADRAAQAARQKLSDIEAKRQKIIDYIEKLTKLHADKQTEYVDALAKARARCTEEALEEAGGMDARPNAEEHLNREYNTVKRRIASQEAKMVEGDSVPDLMEAVERQEGFLAEVVKTVNESKEPLELMKKSVRLREELLKRCANNISKAVSYRFQTYMAKRGHTGRIRVSHEKETLEMEVIMNCNTTKEGKENKVSNTKTLSGGERSYSTLSFTLALNAQSEAPFRAMDEFDVFMDAVNRKVGTGQLLEFAKEFATKQFIYLTPQDVSMLDRELGTGFLRVMRMANASR